MASDTPHAPQTSNPLPTTPAAPPVQAPPRRLPRLGRWAAWCAAGGIAIVAAYFGLHWWAYRLSHSITDDAFVEAHIVNVAPEMVSGRLVRFHVEENDQVEQGQVLAEVEPIHYRDQVEQARGKLDLAEAELVRQEAGLVKLEHEVPLQIDLATETLAVARTEEARAKEALKLTTDEVNRTIEEAQAAVGVAKANAVLAKRLYDRWTALARTGAATPEKAEEVTRAYDVAKAERQLADAKLAKGEAARTRIAVARRDLEAAQSLVAKAQKALELAKTGYDQIHETKLLVGVKKEMVNDARIALGSATHQLQFTQVRAPFPGVVVKRYRHLGDFASAGVPILSMYHPDLTYVTANLEETRLRGVAPGNPVELQVDAFAEPFRGRVVWIDKSTGAQFALMPRNVVSGEFTKVVQRIPVRIAIEKDERWPLLRAGFSVQAIIAHGPADAEWAEQAAREMKNLEARYNQPQLPGRGAGPGDQP
ncbi:MAG TPA: HlyD family secretion protein [Isosphaeraceae bacterium]|nr:HlyD family secretion protein [Isosphaeraceae bacterium]